MSIQKISDFLLDGVSFSELEFQSYISDSQNLNTFINPGIYIQTNNSYATNGSNYPIPYAGILKVIGYGDFIHQTYYTYKNTPNGSKIFERDAYLNNWNEWKQVNSTKNYKSTIGIPGTQGFGVGIYPNESELDQLKLNPMTGTYDINSENYGNYQHINGSVMVFIPKFYYKIGNSSNPKYSTFGNNLVEIVGAEIYPSESDANADGFILHRAFINGGSEKSGFFIDKYLNSKISANTSGSIKNGDPISLYNSSGYTTSNGMPNCTGIYADSIELARARGNGFNVTTAFMFSALAMLSLSHGQFVNTSTYCAWYDPSYSTNFPKGCNSSLKDINDSSVQYISAGNSGDANKPRTGSANQPAKVSHNGQLNGVMDLNGCLWEVGLGITMPGATSTSSNTIGNDTLYIMKESVDFSNFTSGHNSGNAHFGQAAHLSNFFDTASSTVTISSLAGWTGSNWGNTTNQVFLTNVNGSNRALCGVLPKDNNAISVSGINMFGSDGIYRYTRENQFWLYGAAWGAGSIAGIWARALNDYRSNSAHTVGFRVAAYI